MPRGARGYLAWGVLLPRFSDLQKMSPGSVDGDQQTPQEITTQSPVLTVVPLCLAVPVSQIPQGVVPTTQARPELVGPCRHDRAVHDRYHCRISDHQIVHLNEQCGAPDRIELALSRP